MKKRKPIKELTPEEAYEELMRFRSRPIQFFNIGGVYQIVSLEQEILLAEHERLHAEFQQRYQ